MRHHRPYVSTKLCSVLRLFLWVLTGFTSDRRAHKFHPLWWGEGTMFLEETRWIPKTVDWSGELYSADETGSEWLVQNIVHAETIFQITDCTERDPLCWHLALPVNQELLSWLLPMGEDCQIGLSWEYCNVPY